MAEASNTVFTRLALKTHTTLEWNDSWYSDFVPLKGEILVYQDGNITKTKIGDGVTVLKQLPFTTVSSINGVSISEFARKEEIQTITRIDFSITLERILWSTTMPYTQTVSLQGITEKDVPIIELDLQNSEDIAEEKISWGYVDYANTAEGSLTFTCLTDKPTTDLKLNGYYYTNVTLDNIPDTAILTKIQEEKTCKPSVLSQTIYPDEGYLGIKKVIVEKIENETSIKTDSGTTNFLYKNSATVNHNLGSIPDNITFSFTDSNNGQKNIVIDTTNGTITQNPETFYYRQNNYRWAYCTINLTEITENNFTYTIQKSSSSSTDVSTGTTLFSNVSWSMEKEETIEIITPVKELQSSFITDKNGYATIDCGFQPDIVYLYINTYEEGVNLESGISLCFSLMKDPSKHLYSIFLRTVEDALIWTGCYGQRNKTGFSLALQDINEEKTGTYPVAYTTFSYHAIKYS